MPLYKRTSFAFFTIESDELLDVGALLEGRFDVSEVTRLFALSPVTSSKHAVSPEELQLLLRIPADRWSTEDELRTLGAQPHLLQELTRRGLLTSDEGDPKLAELRRRAELLDSRKWHPYAALYHFMTRSAEIDWTADYEAMEAEAAARVERHVAEHGAPPAPFHSLPGSPRIELPHSEKTGELYRTLKRRRTTRYFDTNTPLSLEDLSTMLYYTFGCQGYLHLSPEVPLLKRTSPSGGSRHPVEAYPLILRVENLAPGIYHYNMHDHALELLEEFELEEAEALAVEFGGGQEFMRSAHVIAVMTARFYRTFWKYPRVSRAYSVIWLDVAHLSQTFYLIATDLNLGAFFSAAVNSPRIDKVLALDGYEESALVLCGCGVKPANGVHDRSLKFRSFTPRKNNLAP